LAMRHRQRLCGSNATTGKDRGGIRAADACSSL
jgi:hypothetical protein